MRFVPFFLVSAIFTFSLVLILSNASASEQKTEIADIRASDYVVAPLETIKPQEILEDHMAAIQARDAERAFSLTSQRMHEKFGTAEKYLSNLRMEFRPLYNHAQHNFMEQSVGNGNTLYQKMSVTDRYGGKAILIYKLSLAEEDGKWRIDSFSILDDGEGNNI